VNLVTLNLKLYNKYRNVNENLLCIMFMSCHSVPYLVLGHSSGQPFGYPVLKFILFRFLDRWIYKSVCVPSSLSLAFGMRARTFNMVLETD